MVMSIETIAKGHGYDCRPQLVKNMQQNDIKKKDVKKGMTVVAAEATINAALKVAKDFINSKIGFPLL